MRRHALMVTAAGLTPFGHLAWGYRDRAEFLSRAAEYIVDGLEQNQYVAYAADRSPETLRSELAAMPGIVDHLDSGGIEVVPTADYYVYRPGTDIIDADRAVAKYLSALRTAIANGYSGFRAVADVTPVARTPEQRDALTKLEYLVDRQMAVLPFSALCAYDVDQLGAAANELMCLHPFVNKNQVRFRLYADPDAEMDFTVTGEIDAYARDLFTTALQRIWPLVPGSTLRIGAQALEFIDHHQLRMLEDRARDQNRKVVLWTTQPLVTRLVQVLDLSHVRVDTAPA